MERLRRQHNAQWYHETQSSVRGDAPLEPQAATLRDRFLLGLGAFVTGVATRNSTLMVLGFIGGMYHLINHSLFKTTLFLGAGAVTHDRAARGPDGGGEQKKAALHGMIPNVASTLDGDAEGNGKGVKSWMPAYAGMTIKQTTAS